MARYYAIAFSYNVRGSSWRFGTNTGQGVLEAKDSLVPSLAVWFNKKLAEDWIFYAARKCDDDAIVFGTVNRRTIDGVSSASLADLTTTPNSSPFSPSLVQFGDELLMVYAGTDSQLWLSKYDPETKNFWKGKNLSDFGSWSKLTKPMTAVFDNHLHIFLPGDDGYVYHCAATNRGDRVEMNRLDARTTDGTPVSVAVYQDIMFLTYRATDRKSQYYMTYDGSDWSSEGVIPGLEVGPPAEVFLFHGRLVISTRLKRGEDSDSFRYVTYNGNSFSPARWGALSKKTISPDSRLSQSQSVTSFSGISGIITVYIEGYFAPDPWPPNPSVRKIALFPEEISDGA